MEVEKREEKMGGLGNMSSRVASAFDFSSSFLSPQNSSSPKTTHACGALIMKTH
jgi:hypothetical protein